MLNFDHVRREETVSVISIANNNAEPLRYWLEQLGVTGWQICDGRTVLDNLGDDFPLQREAPCWYDLPNAPRTPHVLYFASFYNKDDMTAKIAEILTSPENKKRIQDKAAAAAKAREFDIAYASDPGPFDFRRDL